MIFCIGHSKTGTRSLAEALRTLGYSVCHGKYDVNSLLKENVSPHSLPYDAFADIPVIWQNWHLLAVRYSQSKFIYTYRDNESWVESRKNHIANHPQDRTWYWFEQSPEEWIREKNALEYKISCYFADRLLWFDVFSGDEYGKLCRFLGKSIPDSPFPHIK